jgi:hypothetical protein
MVVGRILGWFSVFTWFQLALWAAGIRSEWFANTSSDDGKGEELPRPERRSLDGLLTGETLPLTAILTSVLLGLGLAWIAIRMFDLHCNNHPNLLMCSKVNSYPWTTLTGLVAAPCITHLVLANCSEMAGHQERKQSK